MQPAAETAAGEDLPSPAAGPELLHGFRQYLLSVGPAVLQLQGEDALLVRALDEPDYDALVSKFLSDASVSTLYVELAQDGGENAPAVVKLDVDIHPSARVIASLALVKSTNAPLTADRPIASQVQLMTLGGNLNAFTSDRSPGAAFFHTLQQYTRQAFAPLVRAYAQPGVSGAGEAGAEAVSADLQTLQKRLRELELAFAQSQQKQEIPAASFSTRPDIIPAAQELDRRHVNVKDMIARFNAPQTDQLLESLDLLHTVQGDEFANDLNKYAKQWPGQITKITNMADTPFLGSALEEVTFWRNLEDALNRTKRELDTTPVLLTKLILKRTNRVSEQLIREAEGVLERTITRVEGVVSFLRDLPINPLLSATDFDQIGRDIVPLLQHFNKLRFQTAYDLPRAIKLLESIVAAFVQQCVVAFRERRIMKLSYPEFLAVKEHFESMVQIWNREFANAKQGLTELSKKRRQPGAASSSSDPSIHALKHMYNLHTAFEERINKIAQFREQHHRLLTTISDVLSDQSEQAISDLKDAYQTFCRIDVFDISPEGQATWENEYKEYGRNIESLEDSVVQLLDQKLSNASSAEEMFRIFSTFNPLFSRPNIKNAVLKFQMELIEHVRRDVKKLREKFKNRYDTSEARTTASIRDVPPLAGQIIWARQIENQLLTLMKRMEDVLGADWEKNPEGRQLKIVCDELLGLLDINQTYRDWLKEWQKESLLATTTSAMGSRSLLLAIDSDPTKGLVLRVNFDPKTVVLFKEVRHLEWLGLQIPESVRKLSRQAFDRYPVAVAVQAALSTYHRVQSSLDRETRSLVASYIRGVREALRDAMGGTRNSVWVKWESKELKDWVTKLTNRVNELQHSVNEVTGFVSNVRDLTQQLSKCDYDHDTFKHIISQIQEVINDMRTLGISNLKSWVAVLDGHVEKILLQRLHDGIVHWVDEFSRQEQQSSDIRSRRRLGTEAQDLLEETKAEKSDLGYTVHEILLQNQVLYLSPSLEQARADWVADFHNHVSVVCSLPRLASAALQVFGKADEGPKDYAIILQQLSPALLRKPYEVVQAQIDAADKYVQTWLQYQALWDIAIQTVEDKLGDDQERWQQLLQEIRAARVVIESGEDDKAFGPIVINYTQVQNKVNHKYDSWQKEIQSRFGSILSGRMRNMHTELVSAKSKLEQVYLEGPTREVIGGIAMIEKYHQQLSTIEHDVKLLENGERLLERQRFQFPSDWLFSSNVQGAFADFEQILGRRHAALRQQLPTLQRTVINEDKALSKRVSELAAMWQDRRPLDGNHVPNDALQTLALFRSQLNSVEDDVKVIFAAKDALNMPLETDNSLDLVREELDNLQEVWSCMTQPWADIDELRRTPWRDVQPQRMRKRLEEIVDGMRSLPNKIRSYPAYEHLHQVASNYIAVYPLLRDLKTDALKDRHWKPLLRGLGINALPSELTVGHLWSSSLQNQKTFVHEILATAQGELALEEFLREVKNHWLTRELQLAFRDGARLVTGWDNLFSSLEEHLNSLASMKHSPYFKNVQEFQEDTASWEDRLTRLRGILDLWLEVQRRWNYLRGIFNNADIKAQLPSQYSKFKSVDSEFVALMKKVSMKPNVMEVLQIENLHRQLERQEGSMNLIQKALGEYLERQRLIFPRFYFVNNEDLVEIIGNSKEPTKVVPHLSNMFAALSGIEMEGSGDDLHATAMTSRDGELIPFKTAVKMMGPDTGVKDWLIGIEDQMRHTLALLLNSSINDMPDKNAVASDGDGLMKWAETYPAQVVMLATQIAWSAAVENALHDGKKNTRPLTPLCGQLDSELVTLAQTVLQDLAPHLRKKYEQLITEVVYQRDVTRDLINNNVLSAEDFEWLYHLRFYWAPQEQNVFERLCIKMSNATFFYGFEYLGVGERLVQTPLTDRCYLTLTQALHFRMGGNPFGPAGTGKTESVKMLGSQLGRFVLVFNCDENFDFAAMGRLFAGLCQVGAWGCFDEFNRLEERILSAVSQQILTIQRGLAQRAPQIDLFGDPTRPVKLHPNVGIFVTMNPGYAGRSNLPDNLKQLFRAVAMVVPDRKLIAQVMLFSQGITTAEVLSGKIVLLFMLCEEQLSSQSHYDFGLRALKSVLAGAGDLKRQSMLTDGDRPLEEVEREVLIRSACSSIVPKLVAEDLPLFQSLLRAVFPRASVSDVDSADLLQELRRGCEEDGLVPGEAWLAKVLQLKQVLDMRHGVMTVGPTGTGKTAAWRSLLRALERIDGVKGEAYVIDAKAMKKDQLYGAQDPNTLEWTDGVFTKILRRVLDNPRGQSRRHWIVFDGDVDPEWAENLNSVLDDNKILTLPTGDRLKIPPNVRIMMEVDTLKYATLATVSRCGMVWFPVSTVTQYMRFQALLNQLRRALPQLLDSSQVVMNNAKAKETQQAFVDAITRFFGSSEEDDNSLVAAALEWSLRQPHVMEATRERLLETLYSLILRGIGLAIEYNETHEFPMASDHLERFATHWLLFSLLWAFGGSLEWKKRYELGELLLSMHPTDVPTGSQLPDLQVRIDDGEWLEWAASVPYTEIESHRVISSDVVVTTTDTIRHVEVLKAWLASHKPLILCGPPGSGKTMTLTSTLSVMPNLILASLNFSSGTTPELILKTFAQYCEYAETPDGTVLQPNRQSYGEDQWLVIFCDEINLPENDKYGTQRVIMFLRQLTEQGGFWTKDCRWVKLRNIQFVGACNPPTDAGRVLMSSRFMRHAPLLLVDFPAKESLKQIYGTFSGALLKLHPNLRSYQQALTDAMVDFYMRNQARFTADMHPQYIYSPRELSRWVRALYEAMEPLDSMTVEDLVRLWAHEALRLFHDRLVTEEERSWCDAQIDEVAQQYFTAIDHSCLRRPLLYSNWLSKRYVPVERDVLRDFVAARLKVFYEEELDIKLVIFDDVLEHVLRIDNVLRHPMGHLLLVGESGVGKTVLSRFVAWMNNLTIFQIKANNRYTIEQFDEDLRGLLRRVGVEGEKICFIFDESNALSSAFLERMNALLASGEVPGLFEGDDLKQLMASCRDAAQRDDVMIDSEDELFRRFTSLVQRNLHVVFTMNPASGDFDNRSATSPALFNRCVVDWFGTWSQQALAQVAYEFTMHLDTGFTQYTVPDGAGDVFAMVMDVVKTDTPSLHEAVVAALVTIHNMVKATTERLGRATGRQHFISPRDFLDLINKFIDIEKEKRSQLEERQTHIRRGLTKLIETQDQVASLQQELGAKELILKEKDVMANQKLQQMVENQNEAERKKSEAEELSKELHRQNEEIALRRHSVEQELSEAEPALENAKNSVRGIKAAHLNEVRALARPPNAVRLTMEAVAVMLGEKSTDWNEIRKVIRREDFISLVLNFDAMNLSARQIKQVKETYFDNPEFDYEAVSRASKACGPLYEWAVSQVRYSTILRNVQPLREEMQGLEAKSNELQMQKDALEAKVAELEAAIQQYKIEYADAIREIETTKQEMAIVKRKVERAESLLQSLQQESERWDIASKSFDDQMSTLIGDCLVAAAFMTYGGIFDHRVRSTLLADWQEVLVSLGIDVRKELSVQDYLSQPAALLKWRGMGLPDDELYVQNAILLDRFYRFPLVVDPSGQATAFIMQKYSSQKIQQTSFLDSSFFKTLAGAIRFGTPLLVQDVERIDPILNPVLNREFQKNGGRKLIRLGSEEIDWSPKFMIILATRNPAARFPPDVCSRVTLINFTVTPASLQAQTLSAILRSERPDVDNRRTEVLRLQSEQNVKLRELEEALLNQISAVQGAILDDDTVIRALEDIKGEAADLTEEVSRTKDVMAEVLAVSGEYMPLAKAMSRVYFAMERLSDVSFLYQYSLSFFLNIVHSVLSRGAQDTATTDPVARRQNLKTLLFEEVTRRVMRGLLHEDKITFAARLAQISTQDVPEIDLDEDEHDFLMRGAGGYQVSPETRASIEALFPRVRLEDSRVKELAAVSKLKSFQHLLADMKSNQHAWENFLLVDDAENHVPTGWYSGQSRERLAGLVALIVRALRPDRVIAALEAYVMQALGGRISLHPALDLKEVWERDSTPNAPVMICSEPGHDASSRVDALASELSRPLLSVAMGSAEGIHEAEKSIAVAAKSGAWVLLRNIHLCTEWLTLLEKKLQSMQMHSTFRLFLTCEINPKLSTSLLRMSEVLVGAASTGLKANVQRFFAGVPEARMQQAPAERSRLYMLLAWLNAVVQERLRYAPFGWTKRYEFSETDAACALDVIDQWVNDVAGSRTHVDPEQLPWQALRTMLSQSLYGGRIDNPFDQAILDSFINDLFTPASFNPEFAVVKDYENGVEKPLLTLPDGTSRSQFMAWVDRLPSINTPVWLGLPANAEKQLQTNSGNSVLSKLLRIQDTFDETAVDLSDGASGHSKLQQLATLVDKWLATLPAMDSLPNVNEDLAFNVNVTALQRFLAREVFKGKSVLRLVRDDLEEVKRFARGEIKATNKLRYMTNCFTQGVTPNHWKAEYSTAPMTVDQWMQDLGKRCRVLLDYQPVLENSQAVKHVKFWFGGMFNPEAFVTATRQYVAAQNDWSLDDLELTLHIGHTKAETSQDVVVDGLSLEGAVWGERGFTMSDDLRSLLPTSKLTWQLRAERPTGRDRPLRLPLYRSSRRNDLLVEIDIPRAGDADKAVWAKRGAAVIAWSLD